jgi:putative ubiquitin-RnfH superfamily antitoxin RatB of RatAB toxin-antitoxin module
MNSKVGSIAITSIDFDQWFKSDDVPITNIKPKKKNTKKVIYPMFITFAENVNDIFWSKKFYMWAIGKLPKYVTVDEQIIYFNKGNKNTATWTRENISIAHDVKSCIDFFKLYIGIYSKKDETDNKISIENENNIENENTEIVPTIEINEWKLINKYNQEYLIRVYVNDLSIKMKLTTKERNLLLQTIRLGIATKNIVHNNILMENGKISFVNGLLWDEKTRVFKTNYIYNKK